MSIYSSNYTVSVTRKGKTYSCEVSVPKKIAQNKLQEALLTILDKSLKHPKFVKIKKIKDNQIKYSLDKEEYVKIPLKETISNKNIVISIKKKEYDVNLLKKRIGDKGAEEAEAIARNIHKIELLKTNLQERFEFIKFVSQQNEQAAETIARNFYRSGLEKLSIEDRLELAHLIVQKGQSAALEVCLRFNDFGLSKATLQQHLELAKRIIRMGDWVTERGIENFVQKFTIDKITDQEKYKLAHLIAEQGKGSASSLIYNFNELNIRNIDQKEHCKLFKSIVKKYPSLAHTVIYNYEELGITKIDSDERIKLAANIVELEKLSHNSLKSVADELTEKFDKLGFDKSEIHKRISLLSKINNKTRDYNKYYLTNNFQKFGLIESVNKQPQLEKQLELISEVAKLGNWAISCIFENFDKFNLDRLTLKDRINLIHNLIENNLNEFNKSHLKRIFSLNFIKLGIIQELNKIKSTGQYLEHLKLILDHVMNGAVEIAIHINKLDINQFDIQTRLNITRTIIGNDRLAAYHIIKNFTKLGFINDINKLKSVQQKGELAQKIALYDEWAAEGLSENFDKCGFIRDIQGVKSSQDRIDLVKKLAKYGEWAAKALAKNVEKLNLNKAKLQDKLGLANIIALQGEVAATQLTESFSGFGFIRDIQGVKSSQDRIDLVKKLAKYGEWAALALIENFEKLNLNEAILQDKLELANIIAFQGNSAASSLASNIEIFGLDEVDIKERLKVTNIIAFQGDSAASSLVSNIEKFGFYKVDVKEQLKLTNTIAVQGEYAASSLASNIEKFGFDKVDIKERLKLANIIALQGPSAASSLVRNIEKFELGDVDIKERLKLSIDIGEQSNWIANDLVIKIENFSSSTKEAQLIIATLIFLDNKNISLQSVKAKLIMDIKPIVSFLSKNSSVVVYDKPLPKEVVMSINEFGDFISKCKKLSHLEKLFNNIKDLYHKKNVRVYFELNRWLAYSASLVNLMKSDQVNAVIVSNLIQDIYKHRNTRDRFDLVRELYLAVNEQSSDIKTMPQNELERFIPGVVQRKKTLRDVIKKKNKLLSANEIEKKVATEIAKQTKLRPHAKLSWILLSRLKHLGMKEEDVFEVLYLINSKGALKDSKRIHDVLQLLLKLSYTQFNKNEAELIAKHLKASLREKTIKATTKKIQQLYNILSLFGRDVFFKSISKSNDYNQIFVDNFSNLFPLDLKEPNNLAENYQKTFGQFRDKKAFFTYLSSVNSLPSVDKDKVKAALGQYVSFVLNGDFREKRYDENNNPHLTKIFGYSNDVKKLWIEKISSKKVSRVNKNNQQEFDFEKYFYQKIITDKHLDHEKFSELTTFLKDGKVNLNNLEKKKESNELIFQKLAIQLCQKKLSTNEFFDKISQLKVDLGEFQNDINSLKSIEMSSSRFIISETGDPCDLLLIGTEITDSCQRVNGDPKLNKCLVGYLLSEIRPIVVRDANTKSLVARSLLRLMWDEKNKTPVLVQERLYSNIKDDSFTKDLIDYAKAKAKKMNIPLVSKEVGSGGIYDGSVEFLSGGLAPYIYSDAKGGVLKTSEKFSISGSHVLFKPAKSENNK